jgi:N-terminal domain of (some) glycogen debranching enzymes
MLEPSKKQSAERSMHAEHGHHHHAAEQRRARTKRENNERKHRLESDGRSSVTRSIAHAIVLKDRDLFFLSEDDGSVPLKGDHGLGLYYHDCRYLSGYEFKLGAARPTVLVCTAASGFGATLELTNPDLRINHRQLIRRDEIGIKLERLLDNDQPALCDVFTLRNNGADQVEFPIDFFVTANFEPLFAVRGLLGQKLGYRAHPRGKTASSYFVTRGRTKSNAFFPFSLRRFHRLPKTMALDSTSSWSRVKKKRSAYLSVSQKAAITIHKKKNRWRGI